MPIVHTEPSPLSGQTVEISMDSRGAAMLKITENYGNVETLRLPFRVEDYWDRVNGTTWGESNGNPAAMLYGMRAGMAGLAWDDEVLYGKVGNVGVLAHVSEIVVPEEA